MLCVIDIDTTDKDQAAAKLMALFELSMPKAQEEARQLPPMFKSGIRYLKQDPRVCAFKTPKAVYAAKGGDCKQLVLWRCAELRNAGIHATPRIIWLNGKKVLTAHAQVRHPDGSVEDPSHNLGMK